MSYSQQPDFSELAAARGVDEKLLQKEIREFYPYFSVRTRNGLKNNNILYLGDLILKDEQELLRTPNFGKDSLNEVKQVLDSLGLQLVGQIPVHEEKRLHAEATDLTNTIRDLLKASGEEITRSVDREILRLVNAVMKEKKLRNLKNNTP